ncbi:D-Ala-D-Ala carboxypeptidase family metallohydrolase [Jidongwangia harbinensis]|uniref:D-Ala-D-Ala carboxypeptidase family metallohydrolase n=1 Tax=Jidongwangia harbinensis TaxID=2878561 RepID=UPI001CDA1542|nr:D-Ala-D-Ala carboxypeptidase family metallohydrolase [Jidongwangia harbinensis]MCA2213905.1 hypothetical protein [Jidongwangia harbinensis]
MTIDTLSRVELSAETILIRLGWRIRGAAELARAITAFQCGWNLGARLTVNSVADPATRRALLLSERARANGRPTASAHFSFAEFACKCRGRYPECRRIWVRRELLESLEVLRARAYPSGLTIVSGCRCAAWNRDRGGVESSQHLFGAAADVPKVVDWRTLTRWRLFAGIGWSRSTGLARHVDRRDVSGHNPRGRTLERPARWIYAS